MNRSAAVGGKVLCADFNLIIMVPDPIGGFYPLVAERHWTLARHNVPGPVAKKETVLKGPGKSGVPSGE
jgi:hypothetical protein